MEVVISVGILGLVIPLVLALTVVAGQSGRWASDDTKATFLARTILEEVANARAGEGELIENTLPWPDFPVAGDRLLFTADRNGRLLESISAAGYETGVKERGVVYLVSVRGQKEVLKHLPQVETLSRVEVSVESPAAAARKNRRSKKFTQLMDPDE